MPPATSARVVRRAPFSERVKSLLNLWDIHLWLSEELNSRDWEEFDRRWSTSLGIALNLLFIFLRANSTPSSNGDDIFEDYDRKPSGLFASFCLIIGFTLMALSFLNAIYTLSRTKQYRLFHSDINKAPATASARLVKVDSSPAASSPLRFLSDIITPTSAESRTHPDENQDVWEISVWDPLPVCLRLFVLFSPGHVCITYLFLPHSSQDPQPSITVAKTLILCALLSLQGHFLQKRFSQQSKDSTSIYSEVSKEYDSKFVLPNAHKRPVRDVGVQYPHPAPVWDDSQGKWTAVPEVVSSKTYNSPQGFQVRPNSAYASHYDRHNFSGRSSSAGSSRAFVTPNVRPTPAQYSSGPAILSDMSSPIRPQQSLKPFPSPEKHRYSHSGTSTGDGGSLGVYSHAASPLRKTASANLLRQGPVSEVRRREGSPLKRLSTPAGGIHQRYVYSRDE